jgi:pseudouridine-5'-phosphate glycosidase
VKSILDIPKTLEVLETAGVPVIGYKTDEFPAFFTRSSGCPVLQRVDELSKLAAIIKTKYEMGLKGGVVVANPIPLEHEIPAIEITQTIEDALRDAQTQGIQGRHAFSFEKYRRTNQGP